MKSTQNYILTLLAMTITAQFPLRAQNLDNLAILATMNGKCHKLIIGDADASEICEDVVTNAAYKTGRSSFQFVAENKVVGFYGTDNPAKDDQAVLKVERVTLNLMMGMPSTSAPASGTCTYSSPYAGPSLIQCTAISLGKTFSATFVSDGQEPSVKEF